MIDKGINVKKIDLSGVSFPTSDASTCALIYTAVRNTYGFPLYLTNFKINDEKRDSVLVNPIILENQTIINLNDCRLIVTPTEISVGNGVYGVSLESIVDKDGNPRFVEGNITPPTIEGATFNYMKWSLSGTHLMLVVAGSIDDTFSTSQLSFFTTTLPSYINNKIVRINENIGVVSASKMFILASSYDKYERGALMFKESTSLRVVLLPFSTSMGAGIKGFRLQFDLLIDAD